MNTGYWTRACEDWFQGVLTRIRAGTHKPHNQGEWRNHLRRFKTHVVNFRSRYGISVDT